MNADGTDVSKGKSTVDILRSSGEVIRLPFDISHDCGSVSFHKTHNFEIRSLLCIEHLLHVREYQWTRRVYVGSVYVL